MKRAGSWAVEFAIVATLFGVVVYVLLHPLFAAPGSTLFDPAIRGGLSLFSLGDMYTVMWVMAWDAHALWSNPAGLFDANIFHPAPGSLTSSEHMLGHMPIFGPVYAATLNPVLANQVNLFAALTLCGLSMYALLRHWGAGRLASFAGGLVFALCPLRLTIVTHVHLVAGQYLVFSIIALDRFLESGRKRWVVVFATLVALQCLCSFYLAYMSLVALGAYGAAILSSRGGRQRLGRTIGATVAGAIGLIPFVLLALPYLSGREAGTIPEGQELELLRHLSVRLGRLFFVREEGYYVGLSVAALAVVGLFARRRPAQVDWARSGAFAIAVVCIVFSMGPAREAWGGTIPSPYDWASWAVPGFSAMRAPSRFVLISMVGMAALAGLGFDRLARVPSFGPALLAVAVVAWDYNLVERQFPVRLEEVGEAVPPVYRALAELPRGPVVEIPAGGHDDPIEQARESAYTFHSISHWQPLLNGRTGYLPRSYAPLMALARALPDERALNLLQRAAGLRYVVVHFKRLDPGQWSRWRNSPGLRRVRRYGDSFLFEVTREVPADLIEPLLAGQPAASVLGTPLVALPPDERRARVRVVAPPMAAPAGLPMPLELDVRNESRAGWPAFTTEDSHRVRVGYRWRDAAGRTWSETVDGDRLPYDLAPGQSATVRVSVPVRVPVGDYLLTVAVTQGEHWFDGASPEVSLMVVPHRPLATASGGLPED